MRTLTFLFLLALFPLLSKGQSSVTIDDFFDSTTTTACDTVGQTVWNYTYGSTSSLSVGDTIEVYYDWDDGNGLQLEAKVTVDSGGGWWNTQPHSFSTAGAKNVQVVGIGPNGNSDTAYNSFFISDSCTTIQGNVYVDNNSNCVYDTGDAPLDYQSIKVTYNNGMVGYGFTDGSGNYQVDVPSSQSPYYVTYTDTNQYNVICPGSPTQQVSNPPNYNVDFALECGTTPDFSVDHGHIGLLRPGFKGHVHASFDGPVHCQDSLTCIKAILPSNIDTAAPDTLPYSLDYDAVNGDTVIWKMKNHDLSDFQYGYLPIKTDTNATVGDTLCIEIMLCASADADASNNSMMVCDEVVNSWDPNNKEVMPQGSGAENYIAKDQRMEYTINFQNTGTAPAIDIVVEDTLDSDVLRPNSFRFQGSSHTVDKIKIEEDSIFEFHFKDINLPDSGTSQPNSKGFLRFTVDQQPNLADGSVISNNAAIIFDGNPPVITNETMNTIGEPSSIGEREGAPAMSVYPNPASEQLHIRSAEKLEGRAILRDMVGKKVHEQRVAGKRSTLGLSELPSGVYLLSVQIEDQEKPLRKKVMID